LYSVLNGILQILVGITHFFVNFSERSLRKLGFIRLKNSKASRRLLEWFKNFWSA
jgi:hypothetical protein